jgi:hypothetical protein
MLLEIEDTALELARLAGAEIQSPTHGEQEGSARNGHFGPVITRCSCSTSSVIWSAASYGLAMSIAPSTGAWCWSR